MAPIEQPVREWTSNSSTLRQWGYSAIPYPNYHFIEIISCLMSILAPAAVFNECQNFPLRKARFTRSNKFYFTVYYVEGGDRIMAVCFSDVSIVGKKLIRKKGQEGYGAPNGLWGSTLSLTNLIDLQKEEPNDWRNYFRTKETHTYIELIFFSGPL